MNFTEFESLMLSRGISSLAEIARNLGTTPQAVSNWKARDQVPFHIVAKVNNNKSSHEDKNLTFGPSSQQSNFDGSDVTLSDILLILSEQLKVILLTTFIFIFFTFTYVQFIQKPEYVSSATVLLPDNKINNLGGFAGLASQFGVNMPTATTTDLSSPSLYPELMRSRTFAEKILQKTFYTEQYKGELSLLSILTHGNDPPKYEVDTLIAQAVGILNSNFLEFDDYPGSQFSIIKITAPEPVFARNLANVVLEELDRLSRYFKSKAVVEKTSFIENRILSVKDDLESSEQSLKKFYETNRQINSPALQLEQERFNREVEIQKGIFLTLKQQLELVKIEQVQESSIVQVLDMPQLPLGPSNKNLKLSVLLSIFLGLGMGIIIGLLRSYLNNDNMDERKKLRRVKNFVKKKSKEIIKDSRVSGIVSILLFCGLPFYLGYESRNPVFFGRYSNTLMLVNSIYLIALMVSISLYFKTKNK